MKICPSCGSEEIQTDRSNMLAMLGFDRGYKCPDCGYQGRLFLEIEEDMKDEAKEFLEERDDEDFRNKLMQQENDLNRGKLAFGVGFLILGLPLLTLMSLELNFFIGVLSAVIGLALIKGEAEKLNA